MIVTCPKETFESSTFANKFILDLEPIFVRRKFDFSSFDLMVNRKMNIFLCQAIILVGIFYLGCFCVLLLHKIRYRYKILN